MVKSSELKSPFADFDYNDDTRHDSTVKQGILYTVRIQEVFDQLGQLELTPEVVSFVREPNIRSRLEDIIRAPSRFSLTSSELPFLMRAELVDAYFQFKISQHLRQFGEIEIYLTQGERDLFAKPIGTEVIRRLGKRADESLKQQIMQLLASGVNYAIYDIVFDRNFGSSDITRTLHDQAGDHVTSALVPHPSSELAVSHLGGREAVDSTLLFHAMFRSKPATDKERAIYYDGMRRIFQVDGKLPATGKYNVLKLSLEKYGTIPPAYRKVIHNHLIRNLMDAQKIQEVASAFPGEIDASLGRYLFVLGGFLEARNTGIRMEGDKSYFDYDPSKDLEDIAMGAQYLLRKFAERSGTALVPLNTQSASDRRRSEHNVSFFQMLGADAEYEEFWKREPPKMTASNIFELFGITEPRKQQEFYNAYQRLFGEEGFEGGTAEESWVRAVMKLMPDGKMQMAIIDDLYGRDDKIKWFDPFEYAKSNDRRVKYFRQTEFDPNIDSLKKIIDNEIAANERVKQQLTLATKGACPIKIDEGLYRQMTIVRQTIDELAEWDERVVVLLPFVEQDYSANMKTLGIGELRDKEQVTKAYHQAVIRDKAHPDLAQDPSEKIERGKKLNELIRARDELSHRLSLQSSSPAYGVSIYIGNVSAMLRSNQSPTQ